MDSGFQLLDSRSSLVELGFRIPIVSGIPDSLSCIPDSKARDSGFHKSKFPGFPYMGRTLAPKIIMEGENFINKLINVR